MGLSYWGHRAEGRTFVWVCDEELTGSRTPLDPKFEWRNSSPTGFEWSYRGSGPRQLAHAILAHATGNRELVNLLSWKFMRDFIELLPRPHWIITRDEVLAWIDQQRVVDGLDLSLLEEGY